MATIVTNISKTVVFQDSKGNSIELFDFKDGFIHFYVKIDFYMNQDGTTGVKIINSKEIIQFISGCFEEGSNFKEKLFEAFNIDENTQFNGFSLPLGEMIRKENSDIWSIEEALHHFATEYAKKVNTDNENIIKLAQKKYDEIIDSVKNNKFDCKDASKDQEINEKIESFEEDDDDEFQLAMLLASYTIELMQEESLEFSKAVDKAYEEIEQYIWVVISNEDLQKAIEWLKKYWEHGDEIQEWYINRAMKEFNGFTDML